MAKGSQLSQLKSALSHAGLTGKPQQGKKKRKRSASIDKDKEKRTAKLEEIHQRLNPFDTKITKLKHDVGGRKVKGVTGRPARSKQAGLEQRKKTLLKEFAEKERAGGIVDRRFGENDPTMSLEERMLERFTRERQRASKATAFNLEDDDDLTHYGQSLSKLDDFDNVGLGLDEDDEDPGKIDAEVVKRTHFGGFDDEDDEEIDEPAKKKSKAEVMVEVIAKSKEHKLQRQMEREQEDDVRQQLDDDFDALRGLLYASDPLSGSNSIPLGLDQLEETVPIGVPKKTQGEVDYDQHVRELAFDKRAKPKDRTKTEEELALEEKEALEQAERQRQRRMLGLDENDSEDEKKGRGKRKRGGDDLDDDFVEEDEWVGLGAGLDASEGGQESEKSESEDEEESNDDQGVSDDAGAKSTSSDGESEGEPEAEEGETLVLSTKGKPPDPTKEGVKELPFTFPCPSTHEEFLDIVDSLDDMDVPIVVQRIRALYHTSFGPDNKFKLQTLMTILVDHVLYTAAQPTPRFTLASSLLPHITALTEAYPMHAAECSVKKLSIMHKNLKRGLSLGASNPEAKTWPGIPELTLLRIMGSLWPTSDLNHAVVSPLRILMGAYLGLGRVRSLVDVSSGLFLCTLFLQFERLSKRLVPEAVNFLTNTILHIAPHPYKTASSLPGSFSSPDFRSERSLQMALNSRTSSKIIPRRPVLPSLLSLEQPTEQDKVDLLSTALNLLGKYADMYKGVEGFIELYEPISTIIRSVESASLAEPLQIQLVNLTDTLKRLVKFSRQARQPLRLQAHKPIPIPSYIPKFEASTSSYLRRQDPDHERNEAAKLRKQYKQERKGAIRELRKDARFLAGVELEKQKEKDRSYNERMKRVFGSIEGERAEEKTMEREKAREKRRAGRK